MALQPAAPINNLNQPNMDMSMQVNKLMNDSNAFASHAEQRALVYSKTLEKFKVADLDRGLTMFGKQCVTDLKKFQELLKDADEDDWGLYRIETNVVSSYGHRQESAGEIKIENGRVIIQLAQRTKTSYSKKFAMGVGAVCAATVGVVVVHWLSMKATGQEYDKEARKKSSLWPIYGGLKVITKTAGIVTGAAVNKSAGDFLCHFGDEMY